jgi:hypothetical protein
VVEILRPAHRHPVIEAETIEVAHTGAPFAPFLAQFLAQGQTGTLTTAEIADRYETTALLTAEPTRICVATV